MISKKNCAAFSRSFRIRPQGIFGSAELHSGLIDYGIQSNRDRGARHAFLWIEPLLRWRVTSGYRVQLLSAYDPVTASSKGHHQLAQTVLYCLTGCVYSCHS